MRERTGDRHQPSRSPAEMLGYAQWESADPVADLSRLVDTCLQHLDDAEGPDLVAAATAVLLLRREQDAPALARALRPWGDNPWFRHSLARMEELSGNLDHAAEVEHTISRLHGVPEPLRAPWLHLAGRGGTTTLARLWDALEDWPGRAGIAAELDLGRSLSAERMTALSESLAAHTETAPRLQPTDARERLELALSARQVRAEVRDWLDLASFDGGWIAEVERDVSAALAEGRGYSLVRLGDGEGKMMTGERPSVGGALGVRRDGTLRELAPDEYRSFIRTFSADLADADVIGLPNIAGCLDGPPDVHSVFRGCIDGGLSSSSLVLGGWHAHWALESHGVLRRLRPRITGMIGPIDPATMAWLGPDRSVQWLRVPGEARYYLGGDRRGWRSRLPHRRDGSSHYHDAAPRILNHGFGPGELWLVGAGMLGKRYCAAIRRRGAVALDVGSVMDLWGGRVDTRADFRVNPWIAIPHLAPATRSIPSG